MGGATWQEEGLELLTSERRLSQSHEDQRCGMQNEKMNPAGGVEEVEMIYFYPNGRPSRHPQSSLSINCFLPSVPKQLPPVAMTTGFLISIAASCHLGVVGV